MSASSEPLIRKVSFFAQAARTISAYHILAEVFQMRPIHKESEDEDDAVPYTFQEYCASREPALIAYDVIDSVNFDMPANTAFKDPYFPDVQERLDIPSQAEEKPGDDHAPGKDEVIDRIVFKPTRLKAGVDFLHLVKMNTVHIILCDYEENGIEIDGLRSQDFDGDGLIVDLFDETMFETMKKLAQDTAIQTQVEAVTLLLQEAAENRQAVKNGQDPVTIFLGYGQYDPSDDEDYTP